MTTLTNYNEVVQCVTQGLELTGITGKKHTKPDLSHFVAGVNIGYIKNAFTPYPR